MLVVEFFVVDIFDMVVFESQRIKLQKKAPVPRQKRPIKNFGGEIWSLTRNIHFKTLKFCWGDGTETRIDRKLDGLTYILSWQRGHLS